MFLTSFFDAYSFRARLIPSIILVLPIVTSTISWFPQITEITFVKSGIVMIIILSILTPLVHSCRIAGQNLQKRLLNKWGALPSVQYLRHRDATIAPETKIRYHHHLEALISWHVSPSQKEEEINPEDADNKYKSAVDWLISKSRDKNKYNLLFEENVSYGFRRNLLAIKAWGIVLASASIVVNIIFLFQLYGNDVSIYPLSVVCSTIISMCITAYYIFFIKESWVRNAAESYAKALLSTIDMIASE